MSETPDGIVLERHRDLEGLSQYPWVRWTVLTLITIFAVLALANVFGQRPDTQVARSAAADLKLYAPTRMRSGDLFSARFHITAKRDVKNAMLILDPGWAEGMAINTIEPSPLGEASSNGRITLQLGHIPKGESHILWMQFQVNPTNVAWGRPAGVTLADGSTPLLHIDRSYTIFP